MPGQPTERDKCILDPFVRDPILREMSIGSLYVIPDVVATLSKVFGRIFFAKESFARESANRHPKGQSTQTRGVFASNEVKMDQNGLKMDQQGLKMY